MPDEDLPQTFRDDSRTEKPGDPPPPPIHPSVWVLALAVTAVVLGWAILMHIT